MLSVQAVGTSRRFQVAAGLLLCVVAAGCATSAALRHGADAERRQDYDSAVVEYTKAVRQKPDDLTARKGLDRAKIHASQDHWNKGRRLNATGKLDLALAEYELAAELNPTNGDLDEELRSTRNKVRAKVAVAREGKTELQTLIERTRDLPPPGLDLPSGVKMPASLTFRDASSRDIFTAIARFANVSLIFDTAFRDAPVSVDLRNATLENALNTLAGATRTFFRVSGPQTVIVIPDTPAKRREYEEEVVKTFYLSNADLKETMDTLRLVLDARRISPTTANNALTIKDTPERIAAAGRMLNAIDKARPEVVINVELLEVARSRLNEYGLQIASPGSTGVSGSVGIAADTGGVVSLQTLQNLTSSDVLFTGLPSLYQDRREHPHTGQSATAHVRRNRRAGKIRRTCAGASDHLRTDRDRRHAAAADHIIQLREHWCEHHHHTAHPSRRRRVAGAGDFGHQHFRNWLRRPSDLRQSRDQHGDPAAGRRNQHARRPDSRRGTEFD